MARLSNRPEKMDAREKILVLVNPAAGRGRSLQAQPRVAAYLSHQGYKADFVRSQSSEDFERRAAEGVAAGYYAIVALGGDGTFQHLVKATLGADIVLGLLPAGSGNDVAAGLGIPNDEVAAAHAFLRSPPRAIDVLQAHFSGGSTSVYVGGGGLGLDAEAARLAREKFRRWPGASRYVASALWALANFQPLRIEAETDGKRVILGSEPFLFAAAVNAPTYGAGIRIAPEAKMDDGLLDLVLVGRLAWTRLLELIPVMLRTGDVREREIQRFRARRVLLRADRPARFHGDGEVLGEAPVEVENLPGAIRVAAPKRK
jgi:diacylglycerol kinase (ATP)